jgi:nuclear GTP-binding protein
MLTPCHRVPKKTASKRRSLHDKYKIKKRVTQHHRKLRREAKKNPQRRKISKDPGIPNLWPFKEDMIRKVCVLCIIILLNLHSDGR